MQRLIKFRVWDLEEKRWISGPCEYVQLDKVFSLNEGKWYQDDWVFQQFTGLLDKNGKEIYEGDILKFSNLHYEVMWVDWQWVATCPNYNRHHWPKFESFGREARASEVIGNIFETPELLK